MVEYLGSGPPLSKVISVTRDCDCRVNFTRVDNATDKNPIAWDDTTVYVEIDIAGVENIDADITTSVASVLFPAEVNNKVKKGTKWRAICVRNGYNRPIMNGTFERDD